MTIRALSFFLLFSVVIGTGINADDKDLYNRAHRLMADGRYEEAYQIFGELSDYGLDLQKYPDYQFYRAKAAYYSGYLDQSFNDFHLLINRFPKSDYVPYGYFFLGNLYYLRGEIPRAVDMYISSYKISKEGRLDRLLVESLVALAESSPNQVLENLSPETIPEAKRCRLLVDLAREIKNQGGHRVVVSLLSNCPEAEASQMVDQSQKLSRQEVSVGVVLPMSGDYQRYSESIMDGINLKVSQYENETGQPVETVVYDTRGDQLEAGRIVRRLSSTGNAAAIGPLTSEEAAVASAVLSCDDLPLIIPAASQAGLTELSSTSFQLRPNLEWQGLKMADFAVEYLNADTAAIITPTASDNLLMAAAFAKRFEELGGKIIGIEYFRPNEKDFGPYVRDLKSLIVSQLLDSMIFINENGDTIEAEEVPVELDCLYLPAEAPQLRMLLPQIDFYNLKTIYIGGDGWGDEGIYRLGEQITKVNYFTSGRVEDKETASARTFKADFDHVFGREPGFLEALGYDAMALICNALEAGQYSRSEIVHYLSTLNNYQGASGAVSFGRHRENIELPIFSIKNGAPEKIEY